MINTWAQFQQQLTRLLDGEDVSQSTIAPQTLAQIINLGERRIYREVRSRFNEKPFNNLLTSNNTADLPADFEAPSVVHLGKSALEPVTEELILDQRCLSICKYFAIAGSQFVFAGPASDGTVVNGRYYCRLPDLSATTLPTNALFLAETDLFIFACLSQAAPFFDQDARLPLWEGRYTSLRDTINTRHERAAYSSGRIQRRPSAAGMRPLPNYTGADISAPGDWIDDWIDDWI